MDASWLQRERDTRAGIVAGALRTTAVLERILSVPAIDRDAWVDAVLGIEAPPPDAPDLPRGAVPYLPCGVDEIVTMVREAPLRPDDTFVDLGSGLGRVAILAHLLSGARASGIEIQEHLVRSARAHAAELNLADVSFVHGDASEVALEGSVFFLYAPFNGETLTRALRRIEEVARRGRHVVVATVGIGEIRNEPWLRLRDQPDGPVTLYDA